MVRRGAVGVVVGFAVDEVAVVVEPWLVPVTAEFHAGASAKDLRPPIALVWTRKPPDEEGDRENC